MKKSISNNVRCGLTFGGNLSSTDRLYACCAQQRCKCSQQLVDREESRCVGNRRDIHAAQAAAEFHFRAVNHRRNSRKETHRSPCLLRHIRHDRTGGTWTWCIIWFSDDRRWRRRTTEPVERQPHRQLTTRWLSQLVLSLRWLDRDRTLRQKSEWCFFTQSCRRSTQDIVDIHQAMIYWTQPSGHPKIFTRTRPWVVIQAQWNCQRNGNHILRQRVQRISIHVYFLHGWYYILPNIQRYLVYAAVANVKNGCVDEVWAMFQTSKKSIVGKVQLVLGVTIRQLGQLTW